MAAETEVEAATDRTTGRVAAARRRFTLLDIAILVAATAFGCSVMSWLNSAIGGGSAGNLASIFRQLVGARQYPQAVALALMLVLPIAAAWTVALIPIRLIKPRPRFRRLACQPGWMASCGFAVALAFVAAMLGGLVAFNGPNQVFQLMELSPILGVFFGPMVLGSWMALILGRRWRPEPSWVDRLGRALGLFWVLMLLTTPVLFAFLLF